MNKICLAMIVKNEVSIILECLNSVLPFINHLVIHDTGSTDNTKQLIRNFMLQNNLPGEIKDIEFQDYSYNRNKVLNQARAVKSTNYVLMLDADHTVEHVGVMGVKENHLNTLKDEYYLISNIKDGFEYKTPRIFRSDTKGLFIGRTHEYFDCGSDIKSFEGFHITESHLNANAPYKLEGDLKILKEDYEEDPNNTRTTFYLANTFYDLKCYSKALNYYKKRINQDGNQEEKLYAYYKAVSCMTKIGHPLIQIEKLALEAHVFMPDRIEPLYYFAKNLIINGNKNWGIELLTLISTVEIKPERKLFVHKSIYGGHVSRILKRLKK